MIQLLIIDDQKTIMCFFKNLNVYRTVLLVVFIQIQL